MPPDEACRPLEPGKWTVRALLPQPRSQVDLLAAYAVPDSARGDRSFVRCNMVSTLDGAIAVQGRSGSLGSPGDRRVFGVLRSLADVILVGAGTARAEGYGPARLGDELRARRVERGQSDAPPIAVVTGTGELDGRTPFFADAVEPPIVLTTELGAAAAHRSVGDVARVRVAGANRVDPVRALDELNRLGHRHVLLEGGPGLNGDLVRAGLLDELCLTLSPRLVAGAGPRVLAGPELASPLDLDVVHLLEEDGFLFWRLVVRRRD